MTVTVISDDNFIFDKMFVHKYILKPQLSQLAYEPALLKRIRNPVKSNNYRADI